MTPYLFCLGIWPKVEVPPLGAPRDEEPVLPALVLALFGRALEGTPLAQRLTVRVLLLVVLLVRESSNAKACGFSSINGPKWSQNGDRLDRGFQSGGRV